MSLIIFSQFNNVIAGFSTKPDKSDVLRADMTAEAASQGKHLVRPCLVHGNDISCITRDMLGSDAYIELDDIDGLVTDIPGVRLTSTHGDCIPLYAFDPVRKVIGLAHAGWKGTALGIAFELIQTMKDKYGCDPKDIYTYIGPGIGPCHFEFGRKEAEEYFFQNKWTENFALKHENPEKLYLDLKGINKRFFELTGVERIEISSDCTCCMEDEYYSYRRSKEMDRMLAYIELK